MNEKDSHVIIIIAYVVEGQHRGIFPHVLEFIFIPTYVLMVALILTRAQIVYQSDILGTYSAFFRTESFYLWFAFSLLGLELNEKFWEMFKHIVGFGLFMGIENSENKIIYSDSEYCQSYFLKEKFNILGLHIFVFLPNRISNFLIFTWHTAPRKNTITCHSYKQTYLLTNQTICFILFPVFMLR